MYFFDRHICSKSGKLQLFWWVVSTIAKNVNIAIKQFIHCRRVAWVTEFEFKNTSEAPSHVWRKSNQTDVQQNGNQWADQSLLTDDGCDPWHPILDPSHVYAHNGCEKGHRVGWLRPKNCSLTSLFGWNMDSKLDETPFSVLCRKVYKCVKKYSRAARFE